MGFLPDIEDYTDHPDTIEVELAGKTLPWFLGAESFELAQERGVEMGEIMTQLQSLSELDENDIEGQVSEGVRSVIVLVWVGFLVFEPDLKTSEVRRLVSFPVSDALFGPIMQHLNGIEDEQLAEMAEQAADDSGKP